MDSRRLRLLFVSSPVGPLGSGLGGGVEHTLLNLAKALRRRGHQVNVVAPTGSSCGEIPLVEVDGTPPPSAHLAQRTDVPDLPSDCVLTRMWRHALDVEHHYDVIVNFAYDALPFELAPLFRRPVAHLVSMGSVSDAMDRVIERARRHAPQSIAVHTRAQAATFPFAGGVHVLGNGFDLDRYTYQPRSTGPFAWVGRISPEKGLEDALDAACRTRMPLRIMGLLQDARYFDAVLARYPNAPVEYLGFLETDALQQHLGECRGLLVTPKWVEAFGNVVIEALACGVPVIAYDRGGPAEIVAPGETGLLVEPDSTQGLAEAMRAIGAIDRAACRRSAELLFSLAAMARRTEAWLFSCVAESGARSGRRAPPRAELGASV